MSDSAGSFYEVGQVIGFYHYSVNPTVDALTGHIVAIPTVTIQTTRFGRLDYSSFGDELSQELVGQRVRVEIRKASLTLFGWTLFNWYEVVGLRI